MGAPDYGPVPVSRLKQEQGSIFDALEAGRRVLLSRHGNVVAAIEPASAQRHARLLVQYALPGRGGVEVLNAADLSKGAPSKAIGLAEAGGQVVVAKSGEAFGVLGPVGASSWAADVAEQEQALAAFELRNPDASPTDIAAFAERLARGTDDAPTGVPDLSDRERSVLAGLLYNGAVLGTDLRLPGISIDVTVALARAQCRTRLAAVYNHLGKTEEALALADLASRDLAD